MHRLTDKFWVVSWTSDPNGHCNLVDPAWSEFTGQSEARARGVGWFEAVHPDDRERTRAGLSNAGNGRAPFRIEYRLRRVDGVYRWVLAVGAPRFDENGVLLGFFGSMVDIDKRRNAEKALSESEHLHRTLLKALKDGVFVAQNYRFVFANPALPAMLGYAPAEFENIPFDAVVAPETLPLWTERYEARLGTAPGTALALCGAVTP